MKRLCCLLLSIALVLTLTACKTKEVTEPPSDCGDVYRAPYFSEVYDLDASIHIFEVTVERVLENTYHLDWWSEVEYIVMEATVEEVFYQRDESAELPVGGTVLLWTDISMYPQATASLQECFVSSDSLIICGNDAGHWNSTISAEERSHWEGDYGETEWKEAERGFVPLNIPQCIYFSANNWGALPIIEGNLETQGVIDALSLSEYGENFSIAQEDPDHGLFFKGGDSAEQVRSALEKYIKEF